MSSNSSILTVQTSRHENATLCGINYREVAVRALIKDWLQVVSPGEWAKTQVPFPELKDLSTLQMSLRRTSCGGFPRPSDNSFCCIRRVP